MKTTHSIAYQGEPGANSHIACAENFPDLTPLPCATFEDAFAALQDGGAELAVIPIENSIAGQVADIHSLLPRSGLHIVGETFLPIHFQLLAVPGARIEDLRAVYSHIHALGQWPPSPPRASARWPTRTPPARRAKSRNGPTHRAALATVWPAKSTVSDVWRRRRGRSHNTTRFVVLAK